MKKIAIQPGAAKVLAALEDAGYDAYVVGGCVRDALLGSVPNDWDVCTSALPEQTLALFGEESCIPTGLKHGTITVKMDGGLYEVTTFRTEGAYSDGRHPDSVAFVSGVREDLARRDFTINAMAYNDREGLVDPFGGQEDLLVHRIVRAVGEPERRFSEDALRIMRLLRFAARFGFAIEENTYAAAVALRGKLSCVSGERIREELMKLLETKTPGAYLPHEIVCEIVPEMARIPRDAYDKMLRAVDSLKNDAELRLAALLSPLCSAGDTGAAQAVMKRLRCSNHTLVRVSAAVAGALDAYAEGDDALRVRARRMLGQIGLEAIEDIGMLSREICWEEDGRRIARLAAYAREAKAQGLCCSIRELAVTGADLMRALRMKPGPGIGKVLSRLLDAVIEERLANEREALLSAAKEWNGEDKA